MDFTLLIGIGKGILLGAGTALLGYVKNIPDGATFDFMKTVPVLVIGGITGIVGYYMGLPMIEAGEIIASFGVVNMVNQLWSAIRKSKRNLDNKS